MFSYAARDLFRVPGLLSLARLPLALLCVATLHRPGVSLVLLALAGATDVLDGWIARRYHLATPTGALLDAIMDKLFVGAVVVGLVVAHRLNVAQVAMLGVREIGEAIIAARLFALQAPRRTHPPSAFGKLTTCLQYAAITAAIVKTSALPGFVIATAVAGALATAVYWVQEEETVR